MNPKYKNALATVTTVALACYSFLPTFEAAHVVVPAWVGITLALVIQICNDLTNNHPTPPTS